jgi:uncharacterized protein YidB (DUF937 family)
MGLLDSVIGALGSAPAGGGGQPDLASAVIGLLGQGQGQGAGGLGGLAGLVGNFQQGGLGDVVGSWVGTGQNLPITADQLGKVLGNDTVSGLARQLGMGQGDVLGQLSQMLPQVVDKLTPNGQVPQGDIGGMGDLAGLLGGLLKP